MVGKALRELDIRPLYRCNPPPALFVGRSVRDVSQGLNETLAGDSTCKLSKGNAEKTGLLPLLHMLMLCVCTWMHPYTSGVWNQTACLQLSRVLENVS